MKEVMFKLTEEQAKIVLPCLKAAEKYFDDNDGKKQGIVLFQVQRSYENKTFACGNFVPEPFAKKIVK